MRFDIYNFEKLEKNFRIYPLFQLEVKCKIKSARKVYYVSNPYKDVERLGWSKLFTAH